MSRRYSNQMAWQGGTKCLFYTPMNYINVPLTFSGKGNCTFKAERVLLPGRI